MMTHIRRIAFLHVIAVLAVGTAFFQSSRTQAQDQVVSTARPAPAWKLKDLDGREISSDQFKDKVVVVDFWATWCPPCLAEIPGYIELQKKYGPVGLAIVGVSLDRKGPEHVKKFAQARRINYTLVMGDENIVEAFGGFEAIPTTFLINRRGEIVHRKTGAMAHDEYEKLVKQALD